MNNIKKWLKKNKKELREFMDIKFYPFTNLGLSWEVGYDISHNKLNDRQKELSDEFTDMLR